MCVVDSDFAGVKMSEPRDDSTILSSEDAAVGDPKGGAYAMRTG